MTVHSNCNVVELTQRLVACDSVTESPNHAVTDLMKDQLEDLGFEIESFHYTDLHGTEKQAFAARREPRLTKGTNRARTASIGYFCHNDVVSVDGWNCLHGGPFDASIAEERIWGRGSCDMKGSAAAAISALSAIDVAEQTTPIYYFVTGDEECGMAGAELLAGSSNFFAELREGQGVGIIGEPTELQLVNSHKGACHIEVTAEGVAAHSSTLEGDNANWKLIPFLQYLHRLHERCLTDPKLQDSAFEPPTLSFNIVVRNRPDSPNITVGEAVCDLFYRPMPDTNWRTLNQEIVEHAQSLSLQARLLPPLPPVHTAKKRPFVDESLRLLGQDEPGAVCYATDGCRFPLEDLIVIGPGSIEQAHRPNEFVTLEQLHRGVEVFERLFRNTCCRPDLRVQ